uniref:Putative primase n=1 Tax=viral metagenome TaxID=1070528 RepID=A0A6M3JCM2_9ZZZZ
MHFTRNSEPPDLFRRWAAVSTIASALRRKCYLPWGSLIFYPNMYIVLVATAGGRKGTAMGPALEFLEELRVKVAAEAITREALIKELNESTDTIVHPTTGQMEFHASLTIHSEELTVFLGYHNLQLMSDLSDWYDCRRRWTYRTKWMGTDEIIGVWVNLFGATTPELLRESMPLTLIGSGLASRIIFVNEHEDKIEPMPFYSAEDMKLKEVMLGDLDRIKMLQGPFKVTEDFVDEWNRWYTFQRRNPPLIDKNFGGYMKRRGAHAMKLSTILNSSRTDSMTLTSSDLQNSVKLLELTEVKMAGVFAGVGKAPYADVLSGVMAVVGNKKEVHISELMYEFRNDIDDFNMRRIINSMDTMGFATFITNTGMVRYKEG